jgi:hypothetical protein
MIIQLYIIMESNNNPVQLEQIINYLKNDNNKKSILTDKIVELFCLHNNIRINYDKWPPFMMCNSDSDSIIAISSINRSFIKTHGPHKKLEITASEMSRYLL